MLARARTTSNREDEHVDAKFHLWPLSSSLLPAATAIPFAAKTASVQDARAQENHRVYRERGSLPRVFAPSICTRGRAHRVTAPVFSPAIQRARLFARPENGMLFQLYFEFRFLSRVRCFVPRRYTRCEAEG